MREFGEYTPQPHDEIEISAWDSNGPELEDNVASFTIKDPEGPLGTANQYCIGYKFLGGKLQDPSRWSYDHTNYWDYDTPTRNEEGEVDPQPVPKEQLDGILQTYSTTADKLLVQYCKKLKDIK